MIENNEFRDWLTHTVFQMIAEYSGTVPIARGGLTLDRLLKAGAAIRARGARESESTGEQFLARHRRHFDSNYEIATRNAVANTGFAAVLYVGKGNERGRYAIAFRSDEFRWRP